MLRTLKPQSKPDGKGIDWLCLEGAVEEAGLAGTSSVFM